ncbi:MAG TPA: dynamin family protein [Saprospiraceae bacterium]|nr:dynamin family protein [Saprospiraceae bacterium]
MSKEKLLNSTLQALRAHVDEAVKDLHELAIRIDHEEIASTVSDLRSRIHDPFMFVIVGEVKSGKSSFVNALLDTQREVTAVAAHPMTDTIQQILYGEKDEVIEINEFLKKIHVPVDILKEIAIVDTPGTNTIVENHQAITERFIPASDLIVFVFEAKNPYRQSAWDFFDYISEEWRKKVIFILQQKDLLPEADLQTNLKGVKEQANKKSLKDPVVFAVSAKQEQEGDKANSGFQEVRQFIKENITGGQAPYMKLENSLTTAQRINESISEGLDTRRKQYKADQEFRTDITETLDHQEQQSVKQVNFLVENILAGYDRITQKKEKELKEGLSFWGLLKRSVSSVFSKKASAQEWLEGLAKDLEEELNTELKIKLSGGIDDLADSVQQMARMIDLKIRNSKNILSKDDEIFSDIAEKRSSIFRDLRETFEDFIKKSENFTDKELFPNHGPLGANIATGSGIAVVGIILAAVVQGGMFDITGGILTAIGLIFAGLGTSGKRKKVIRGFQQEIAKGREKLNTDVTEILKTYIKRLKNKIDGNFHRFDEMLQKEEQQIAALTEEQVAISQRLEELHQELRTERPE